MAGLRALLVLRDVARDRVELTLLSPDEEFMYRPMAVAEPFEREPADGYVKRVAFVVPSGVAWSLLAYELALMTAWHAWGWATTTSK